MACVYICVHNACMCNNIYVTGSCEIRGTAKSLENLLEGRKKKLKSWGRWAENCFFFANHTCVKFSPLSGTTAAVRAHRNKVVGREAREGRGKKTRQNLGRNAWGEADRRIKDRESRKAVKRL